MAKIGIDLGHNDRNDVGARGYKESEDELIMQVGKILIPLLEKDHEVIICAPKNSRSLNDSLRQRSSIANANRCDRFYSIHFNAFNRQVNGTEMFAISSTGRQMAQSILDEVVKLGYNNRGVKDGRRLSVVRLTNMPAVLIECCFCDAPIDMNQFCAEKMATAIYNGIKCSL